jgi:hypothetical protein
LIESKQQQEWRAEWVVQHAAKAARTMEPHSDSARETGATTAEATSPPPGTYAMRSNCSGAIHLTGPIDAAVCCSLLMPE